MLHYMVTFFMLLMTANVRAKCVRPVVGENRILSEESNEQTFADGSSVKFKCLTGYVSERSSASRSITCMGTQWSHLQLQCKKKSCGNPGEISNGKYLFPEGIHFGSTITAHCNKGFRLVGHRVRNCRETGWDGRDPVCEVVKCLKPPSIANGMFYPMADSYDYKHVATYSCKGGRDLIGPSEVSCSDDGTFQPSPPQCLFVSCERPVIPNAIRIEGKSPPYKYNQFVRYQCNEGYRMEGSDFLLCKEDGWNPTPPQCTVITCSKPPDIANGQFYPQKLLYEYGQSVEYSCNLGFRLSGISTVSCTDDGTFQKSPRCLEITCNAPAISNAVIYRSSPSYKYGISVQIQCNEGYRRVGSEYLTCKENGWSSTLPLCIEVICDAPKIYNAFIVGEKLSSYRYKMTIQYQCNEGYSMEGSDRLTCKENGWNPSPPNCNLITCSKPPDISNGKFYPQKSLHKHGETVKYSCNLGFRLSGNSTISCTDDGTFQKSPQCLEITCNAPDISNAVMYRSSPSYKYDISVQVQCNEGYRRVGSEYLTCTENGWSPTLPLCIEVICGAPNIKNAFIVEEKVSSYGYKMTIQYRCNKGYRMEGSDRLTCKENGWNPLPPTCNIVTCSKLPLIKNGQFKPEKELYKYGETVTYSCEEGFKHQGVSTISCTDDGTFQGSPWCLEVNCDAPNINNAVIVGEKASSYRYKMTIQYQCNEGYIMEGSDLLTCKENGWNPPPPKCTTVTCSKLPVINNGKFNSLKEFYEYGETVIYSCEEGFKLQSASTLSCTDDGTFQTSPRCLEVICDEPNITNAVIIKGKASSYRYKMTIQYQCNEGYIMEGSDLLTCYKNGWKPPPPKCNKVTCDEPRTNRVCVIEDKSKYYGYKSSVRVRCNTGNNTQWTFNLTCVENEWKPVPSPHS